MRRRYLLPIMLAVAVAGGRPATAGPISDRIYPAPTSPLTLSGLPSGTTLVSVRTSDGLQLRGLAIDAREAMPTLLVLHGNGSSAATAIAWFGPLIAHGYGVVAAEYRGYSGNPGKPDEAGLAADADAFFALARARAGQGRVWVVGHSLGGGVAFGLARRHRLDALITIATFTRLRAMVPGLARGFVPDAYRNDIAVAGLDEPYFLIHGARDPVVPLAEGERLHAAAGKAKIAGASFVVTDAEHAPEATSIAAIFGVIGEVLQTRRYSLSGLPPTVKVVLFGTTAAINP